jgi:predicted transcriptional regulator
MLNDYGSGMKRLLEEAIETVSALPDDVQDDLARILLQFAGVEQPPYVLTSEEEADIEASLAEAERGEFATEEEVRAMWTKHGL